MCDLKEEIPPLDYVKFIEEAYAVTKVPIETSEKGVSVVPNICDSAVMTEPQSSVNQYTDTDDLAKETLMNDDKFIARTLLAMVQKELNVSKVLTDTFDKYIVLQKKIEAIKNIEK